MIRKQAVGRGNSTLRVACVLALVLGACTTVEAGGPRRSQLYFGTTSVNFPQTQGNVDAIDVRTFGIGWDEGPYLGWRSVSRVTADPRNCHLLIIIRSAAETANAMQIINALEGQDPCIVDYTSSLQR